MRTGHVDLVNFAYDKLFSLEVLTISLFILMIANMCSTGMDIKYKSKVGLTKKIKVVLDYFRSLYYLNILALVAHRFYSFKSRVCYGDYINSLKE